MDRDEMRKERNAQSGTRNEQEARSEEHSDLRPPTSDSASFEALLSSLVPRATGIDRDRLMFLAGQRERGQRGRWAWPAAFSAMTALAASLLIALVARPGPQVVERIVRVPVEQPAAVVDLQPAERDPPVLESGLAFSPARPDTAFGESYLHARDQVLAFGLDSWMSSNPSAAASSSEPPASYRELRESLLQ
ncbi:MAG TPA: hypothetical protein VGN42_25765 [Pirellulales bacterium]|jgi:hypothetical protein|nr:hypothetical protein [Pirellulales bacterium]